MKEWQQRKFGELYKVPSRNGLSKPIVGFAEVAIK